MGAVKRVRDAANRLVLAHIDLLKAELTVTGQQLAIIIGLAVAALLLVALLVFLIYIGTFLFLGEWLFGSIGWGLLHGSLFTICFILPIVLDLSGASVGAWVRGFATGVAVTILLSILFASNVLRDAAVNSAQRLEPNVALEPALLPTLVGAVAGAALLGVVLGFVGLRSGRAIRMLGLGLLLGFVIGAILGSVTFDTQGAIAVSLTIGLVTWIAVSVLLAVRRGIDPQGRYDQLVPRESMAAIGETKAYLQKQWRRQRGRMMGR